MCTISIVNLNCITIDLKLKLIELIKLICYMQSFSSEVDFTGCFKKASDLLSNLKKKTKRPY